MTFDAREAVAAAEQEYPAFPFIGLDGKDYELPNPYMIEPAKVRIMLDLDEGSDLEGVDQMEIAKQLMPDAWEAMDKMPVLVQRQLVQEWQKHCGMGDDDDETEDGAEGKEQ